MMFTRNLALAACIGVMGATLQANSGHAMTFEACEQLQPNQYLAAIERGECQIANIETAAGPSQSDADNGGGGGGNGGRDKERTGRSDGGGNGGGGGGNGGGGGRGGNSGGGRGGNNAGGPAGRP